MSGLRPESCFAGDLDFPFLSFSEGKEWKGIAVRVECPGHTTRSPASLETRYYIHSFPSFEGRKERNGYNTGLQRRKGMDIIPVLSGSYDRIRSNDPDILSPTTSEILLLVTPTEITRSNILSFREGKEWI